MRYIHITKLHFRLTITRPDTLPALLFERLNSSLPLPNLHTSTLDYHIRYATHAFKVDSQTDILPDMTRTLQPTKNRERAFRNMMRKTISTLWRGQLYNAARTHAFQSPGRKASYIRIAHADLQRLDLFKPAQFVRIPHNQLPLLRLRTQATNYIPTHLHLSNTNRKLRMPNDIASCVSPYKSLEMRLIPLSIVPTSLHSPNPQSIASCSTFDNATSVGHHLFQHPLLPYDEKSAQDVAKLLPRMKEQASTARTTTHPLFMTPFTPEDLKHEIKKLHSDKSQGPSGITNRMLQSGDTDFQGLILIFELLNTLTHNQLGTKPDTQTHDAIYSLFAIIQHNKYTLDKSTYVAFIDYSTAYPSVHRDGLSSTLLKNDIRGNM